MSQWFETPIYSVTFILPFLSISYYSTVVQLMPFCWSMPGTGSDIHSLFLLAGSTPFSFLLIFSIGFQVPVTSFIPPHTVVLSLYIHRSMYRYSQSSWSFPTESTSRSCLLYLFHFVTYFHILSYILTTSGLQFASISCNITVVLITLDWDYI